MPRIHCPVPLASGAEIELPAGAARHVQVLRMQPGETVTLFNGEGGEFEATVRRMGRSDVVVEVGAHHAIEREASREIHLAFGMPANERVDWLIEKATELGAASFQPLVTERTVLRLKGERAEKKQAHWQAIAVAACEQCGRNRVPSVHEPVAFETWLSHSPAAGTRRMLSLAGAPRPLAHAIGSHDPVWLLSGPEGGLSPTEEAAALERGWVAATLGGRTLRAETAPLAALAALVIEG
jgi:16S rRNA (uracil1498-N3)-methyltransferase